MSPPTASTSPRAVAALLVTVAAVVLVPVAVARAQTPAPVVSGVLSAPHVRARGVAIPVRGRGAPPRARIVVQSKGPRGGWRRVARTRADARGRYRAVVRPRPIRPRVRLRAVAAGATAPTRSRLIRVRAVTLAAVGDVNLGDGPGGAIARFGARYPWTGVRRALRGPDIAFANLECSISRRGAPVPKEFNFRGRPSSLRAARRYAGLDVVDLANNHVGDYGTSALLDTIAWSRRFGLVPFGAGRDRADALRPRVVSRFGLKVAFVGFSEILPAEFFATGGHPGTAFATEANIHAAIRRARRRAPVVIAAFHWGTELQPRPNARQRELARVALDSGADAIIGAHPHVLQPVEHRGRRPVAFSLGNFVFGSTSPATTRTGILRLRLSRRGVESRRFVHARIRGTRPVLGR